MRTILTWLKWSVGFVSCFALAPSAGAESPFVAIFDGRTLDQWEAADPSFWSVEDGAITGRITPEHPGTTNQYLVWTGGELADFELKLKSRLRGDGAINNGFQFRSRLLPDHDVCGFQMDNNLDTPWLVRLYDEYGRHTLAMRGERALYDTDGTRRVETLADPATPPWFRLEDWHEYHLICDGPKITLHVDGRLAAEVVDQDPRRHESQGILALQLHSGPPTLVQFKDIQLAIHKPADPSPPVTKDRPEVALHPLRESALAWWPLDVGGHGSKPGLTHEPQFERIELNVGVAGKGAMEGTRVVVLDGAYFHSEPSLPVAGDQLTVYLRLRSPSGEWDAGLIGKRHNDERGFFEIRATDLPATLGSDICFEVETDQQRVTVGFPVSEIEADAWHGFVGRYDGHTVTLFCDGRPVATQACVGKLLPNRGPLLIGATRDGETVIRHFHGEMQEAALWNRALTDEELGILHPSANAP